MSSIDELSGLLHATESRLNDALSAANAAREAGEQLTGILQGVGDDGSAARTRTVIDGIDTVLNTISATESDVSNLRGQAQAIRS
ncbi:hypothetical protein [Phytomonospora endophytica]|uniref:ABC-type sulfate transport system substrate-binding protein n=1 Tax=Phytomonospora endophytica TaxID=714109 RepID=A0A841FQX7_9ACTN|nr:hypothetical protein [Phytomonospora endophytica]MBB6038575.1 ABC-type sulfate transport system substrate-binding protein [Phytomonospora endophytica]GIG69283.1 hypothetical protein Pen01_55780 [Phytomonospora endophytica]